MTTRHHRTPHVNHLERSPGHRTALLHAIPTPVRVSGAVLAWEALPGTLQVTTWAHVQSAHGSNSNGTITPLLDRPPTTEVEDHPGLEVAVLVLRLMEDRLLRVLQLQVAAATSPLALEALAGGKLVCQCSVCLANGLLTEPKKVIR